MAYRPRWRKEMTDKFFQAVLALDSIDACYRFFGDVATIKKCKV